MKAILPDPQPALVYHCGSCSKFSQCYSETSQLLLNLGLPALEGAEDDCRGCLACDTYEAAL